MHTLFSLLLLTAFLLPSCARGSPEQHPSDTPPPVTTPSTPISTNTSPPPRRAAATEKPTLAPTFPPPTSTATSEFIIQPEVPFPPDRPLIAYEAGSAQNKILVLADPFEGTTYEFRFPAEVRFATPFLAGLSPDARYFVTFEGGRLETLYEEEHLRASEPDLALHILDLHSGEVIFSVLLLSPSYPQNLEQVAENIKDEWWFRNDTFSEVVSATQEFLLDTIRSVTWSPDGSLLAFASQDPGPTSDLYFFSPGSGTARNAAIEPGHVLRTIWAPDSSALAMITSLYLRQAREDTTYLFSREGSLRSSFTSQIWYFHKWHDSTYGFLYGATDSGENFELKTISAADGMINLLWNGSYMDIAFTPDLSTFLLSSYMPSAPAPPHPGLFLGKLPGGTLRTISEDKGWGITYWGSESYPFAASFIDDGTAGVTPGGALVKIDDGYWQLAASPDGSRLAGYSRSRTGDISGIRPGLRVFDGKGRLLESKEFPITCVRWNSASTALAYQVENSLYLWDAASGSTRIISDQLNEQECAFIWVREPP